MIRISLLAALILAAAGCDGRDDPTPTDDAAAPDRTTRLAAQAEGYLLRAEEARSGDPNVSDLERALEEYGKAVESYRHLLPSEIPVQALWRAHRGRFEVLMRLARFEEALAAADDAAGLAPTEVEARWLELERLRASAEVSLARDDFPGAIHHLERLLQIEPEHPGAAARLDAVRKTHYLKLRATLAAMDDLAAAFRERYGDGVHTGDAHDLFFRIYDLALLARADGRSEQAFDGLQQGVSSLRGIEAEAGSEAFRARGYDFLLGHFMNLTGLVLIDLGRYDVAAKAFETAIATDPENSMAVSNARALGL